MKSIKPNGPITGSINGEIIPKEKGIKPPHIYMLSPVKSNPKKKIMLLGAWSILNRKHFAIK